MVASLVIFPPCLLPQERAPHDQWEPVIVLELGRLSDKAFGDRVARFWESYEAQEDLYIISYGTSLEISRRERLLTNTIRMPCFPQFRITLVRGGSGTGPRTVIWSVPAGADNPEP